MPSRYSRPAAPQLQDLSVTGVNNFSSCSSENSTASGSNTERKVLFLAIARDVNLHRVASILSGTQLPAVRRAEMASAYTPQSLALPCLGHDAETT